ncbi:MAG TPA: hypothetical protein PKG89_14690, partial [Ferruginibacter sp.]|nr:hypothetical protein [Ferruginibacter sp.]
MSKKISRRRMLQMIGISAGAAALPVSSFANDENGNPILLPENTYPALDKPVTAIVCGAGNRGNVYGNFALSYPDKLDIVGVAEPIAIRNERYTKKHGIREENRFVTWEDVFKKPKFA